MNEPETRMVLAQASALDNRKVTDAMVAIWYEVFQGYAYDEVKWALMRHARTSTEYLTPAHLTTIIHEKRTEYRWMNPSAQIDASDWVHFEHQITEASRQIKQVRAANPGARYAVEAMEALEA